MSDGAPESRMRARRIRSLQKLIFMTITRSLVFSPVWFPEKAELRKAQRRFRVLQRKRKGRSNLPPDSERVALRDFVFATAEQVVTSNLGFEGRDELLAMLEEYRSLLTQVVSNPAQGQIDRVYPRCPRCRWNERDAWIWAKHSQGMSHEELAETLSLSRSTVRGLIRKYENRRAPCSTHAWVIIKGDQHG